MLAPPGQGRSSGPMQPAAGISALSTETICGPKTETTAVPAAREQAQMTRIIAGQWRWRWDLNPRKTCAFTRFRGVRPRPLGDSTTGEPTGTSRPRRLLLACGAGPALGEEVAQQGTAFVGED